MRNLFLVAMTVAICVPTVWLSEDVIAQEASFSGEGLIPSSTTAAVFIRPKAIFDDPAMELVPHEILSALGKQELGVDPCECVTAMLLVDSFDEARREPPGFAVMFKFASAQSLKESFFEDADVAELRGKPLYRFYENEPVIYLPNDKTIVFGMEPFIDKMMSAQGAKSTLIDLIQRSKIESEHSIALVSMEPIRGLVDGNLPPKNQLPLPFQDLRDLPDLIETLALRLNFDETPTNSLEITGVDEESAEQIDETIRQAVSMGRDMLMGSWAQELGNNPKLFEAVEAYNDRIGGVLDEGLTPKREGNRLVYEAKNSAQLTNVATIGTLIGMLLPAVQQVRAVARRVESQNKLRQIALACLNYESAHMRFPSNIQDDDGNVLLSWRVAILPYVEENRLYDKFHKDEPWDSEHNIKLLDEMPDFLKSRKFKSDSKTIFLGFEGPGTIFEPGQRIGFGSITDGSSNTILCVEADREAAIPWSKPEDIPFDPEEAVTQVGKLRDGLFAGAICDGSVYMLSSTIDWKSINHMIQRSDGNVVDWNSVRDR